METHASMYPFFYYDNKKIIAIIKKNIK